MPAYIHAWRSVGVCPCDKCSMQKSCKSRLVACDHFANYVEHGWAPTPAQPAPTKAIYNEIYLQEVV